MTGATFAQSPRPIIHLNGLPGVGKLTIARHLVTQLPSAKLVHNHLLINPADAILHRTEPGYQSLRRGIRRAVFSALTDEPATFETTYIFTDFQSDDELGASVCAEYLSTAEARRAAFVPIVLFCDEKVNQLPRIEVSPSKCRFHSLSFSCGSLKDLDRIQPTTHPSRLPLRLRLRSAFIFPRVFAMDIRGPPLASQKDRVM